jgi:hypothetical protein
MEFGQVFVTIISIRRIVDFEASCGKARGGQTPTLHWPARVGRKGNGSALSFSMLEEFDLAQALFGFGFVWAAKVFAGLLGEHFVAFFHFLNHLAPPILIFSNWRNARQCPDYCSPVRAVSADA